MAAAKENKETALHGSLQDNVRRVAGAASGTMNTRNGRGREYIQHHPRPETQTVSHMQQHPYNSLRLIIGAMSRMVSLRAMVCNDCSI